MKKLCLTLMKNINSGEPLLGQFGAGFNEMQTAKLCQPQINEKNLDNHYAYCVCYLITFLLPVSTSCYFGIGGFSSIFLNYLVKRILPGETVIFS